MAREDSTPMHEERTHKVCCRCAEYKPRSDYYASRHKGSNRDGLQSYCKDCAKQGVREWNRKNNARSRASQRQRRVDNPEWFRAYDQARWINSPAVQLTLQARDRPCTDCGVQLPAEVMELDHVRGEKSFAFGGRIRDRDPDSVVAEIAKCDVRCPNCHRLRHYLERQDRKA